MNTETTIEALVYFGKQHSLAASLELSVYAELNYCSTLPSSEIHIEVAHL